MKESIFMPVAINELVIKIVVDDQLSSDRTHTETEHLEKEVIIIEHVEQIPEILKKEKEG